MRWLISQYSRSNPDGFKCPPRVSTLAWRGVLCTLLVCCVQIIFQQTAIAFQGEKKADDTKLMLSVREKIKLESEPPYFNYGLAFSGNGMIATGNLKGKVFIFDSTSGEKKKTLVVGDHSLVALAFSHDNARIATSCTLEKGFRVFEVATGRELYVGSTNSDARRLVFHPNGKELIVGGSNIQVHDATSGKLLRSKNTDGITGGMALSPDGKKLAAVTFPFPVQVVRVWNLENLAEVFSLKPFEFKEAVSDICFSPCGKWFATASDKKKACIWDAKTGELVHNFKYANKAISVAFSNDSKFLAVGTIGESNEISFRDTSSGEEVLVLKKLGAVSHIAFDRKSNLFARCGGPSGQVWEVTEQKVEPKDAKKSTKEK